VHHLRSPETPIYLSHWIREFTLLDIDPHNVEAVVQAIDGSWLHFERPSRIVQTADAARVGYTIRTVEELTVAGAYAVGFLTYEAGAAFGLRVREPRDLPLAWFAIFEAPPALLDDLSTWSEQGSAPQFPAGEDAGLRALTPTMTADAFQSAFDRIKAHIAAGDTYQANYTFRVEGVFSGRVRRLFADLVRSQGGQHSAFIHADGFAICSASPELFFRRVGRQLTTRPMKGTARRGRTLAEDSIRRDRLRESPKERAENVMIVDMMRNDIGRVAGVGTVSVPELFTIERYPTVWQMTSGVTAETDAGLEEIVRALHPSASVTGAPKVRTMEILAGLESGPRGVYTGAIGYVAPGGDARFNVAIRTAVVDVRAQRLTFGVGSGIVWDSSASGEYEECLLKAAVLSRVPPEFELLETMRWSPGEGFYLLERHLRRLRESAEYFGFAFAERAVVDALERSVSGAGGALRVRLRLSPSGVATVECTPLQVLNATLRVKLAAAPVSSDEVFLFHKTTNRGIYDRARLADADDVLLWNERQELTESTIANIVVELDGARVTPPVDCGLLAGTLRGELLDRGEISERIVTVDDLRRATRLWLINSVQGWRSCQNPETLSCGG
jgi:para-aminobenzoate synthetase/4-amino-4-deoxychorismate lyase